jgi:hypothetical protein
MYDIKALMAIEYLTFATDSRGNENTFTSTSETLTSAQGYSRVTGHYLSSETAHPQLDPTSAAPYNHSSDRRKSNDHGEIAVYRTGNGNVDRR